jgi:hypothetical protein
LTGCLSCWVALSISKIIKKELFDDYYFSQRICHRYTG